jgi:hypothetical protein
MQRLVPRPAGYCNIRRMYNCICLPSRDETLSDPHLLICWLTEANLVMLSVLEPDYATRLLCPQEESAASAGTRNDGGAYVSLGDSCGCDKKRLQAAGAKQATCLCVEIDHLKLIHVSTA